MQNNEKVCAVLIVDDDNDLCLILEARIRKLCPVHVEHTLKDTGQYLESLFPEVVVPQVILLDNNLPDGNGVNYIRHIHDQFPTIKVVIMTADIEIGLKECALSEGAIYFIPKPFKWAVINDVLLSLCPELKAA